MADNMLAKIVQSEESELLERQQRRLAELKEGFINQTRERGYLYDASIGG
ncbi:hypothetical protein ACFLWN_04445 [Chloroflexota bacterium]